MGKGKHTNVQLLNEVERIANRKSNRPSYYAADVATTAAFLFPKSIILDSKKSNVTVELHGSLTRGQTIAFENSPVTNVNVISKISEDEYKNSLLWAANYDE